MCTLWITCTHYELYLTALELDYELEQHRQLTDDLKFQRTDR